MQRYIDSKMNKYSVRINERGLGREWEREREREREREIDRER